MVPDVPVLRRPDSVYYPQSPSAAMLKITCPVPILPKYQFTVVLAVMVLAGSVSIMSTDLYAPSLPHITDVFHTTPELVKLTISLNLMVYGVAQLFYGPLSDRFGRRPVLLWSVILFSLASAAAGFARSIDQLILARILQGIFASAEVVICLSVFKDLFTELQQVKAFAIYGMAIALAPCIAPIAGGYIHVLFGWEYNFYLVAVLGMVTAGLIFVLIHETTRPDSTALRIQSIAKGYWSVFSNRTFMVHGALAGVALGLIYAFVVGAPFILIDHFGIAVDHFGYYQAAIVIAYFLGSMLSTRLIDSWRPMNLLNLGLCFTLLGAFLVAGLVFLQGRLSPNSLTLAYMIIGFGLGPVFAVVPSKALASIEKSAGSAAAAFGAMEVGISGLIAGLVSLFHDDTPGPFGLIIGITAILGLILGYCSNRLDHRKPPPGAGSG